MIWAHWLDRMFLLAAVALSLYGARQDWEPALLVLSGAAVMAILGAVGAAMQGRPSATPGHWFVPHGRWAWAIALGVGILAIPLALGVQALLDEGELEGWSIAILIASWMAALHYLLIGACHAAMFRAAPETAGSDAERILQRFPRGPRTALRFTGAVVFAAGVFSLILGGNTALDPSAMDYWYFGAIAIPGGMLIGGSLWAFGTQSPVRVRIVDET